MKGRAKILSLILCFLLLTGCYAFGNDEFYSLPKRSEHYRALQTAVEAAIHSAPRRKPVSAKYSTAWTGPGNIFRMARTFG